MPYYDGRSTLKICPPEKAKMWTGTKNPGALVDISKWDHGLLCDLAHVSGSNPGTIKEVVRILVGNGVGYP